VSTHRNKLKLFATVMKLIICCKGMHTGKGGDHLLQGDAHRQGERTSAAKGCTREIIYCKGMHTGKGGEHLLQGDPIKYYILHTAPVYAEIA
jgi:hypothetical protein